MKQKNKILWFTLWGVGLLGVIALVAVLNLGAPSEAATPKPTGSDIHYTLRTGINGSNLVFYGVGDSLDGVVNPELRANPGDQVTIELVNGDGGTHDVSLPDFDALSDRLIRKGDRASVTFKVQRSGEFDYFCTVLGHRAAGMEGKFVVGQVSSEPAVAMKNVADISRDPSDLPPPIGNRPPKLVKVYLEAQELDGKLDDGLFDRRVQRAATSHQTTISSGSAGRRTPSTRSPLRRRLRHRRRGAGGPSSPTASSPAEAPSRTGPGTTPWCGKGSLRTPASRLRSPSLPEVPVPHRRKPLPDRRPARDPGSWPSSDSPSCCC